jgi:hypothetical protein
MNTRIDQLIGQALDEAVPETWQTLTHAQLMKVMDKFAQLIIRDCIAAVEPTEYHKAFPDDYIGSFEGLELLEAAVGKIKKRFDL